MTKSKNWDTVHCLLLLAAGLAYWLLQARALLLVVALPSFAYLIVAEWGQLKKLKPFAGYANWVTLLRLLLLAGLFVVAPLLLHHQVAIVLMVLVLLDGLDGFLARMFHHESGFGAYFDMETDALYVCLVSIMLFERGLTPGWVLFVGFTRYIYVALVYALGLHTKTEKRTRFGPAIAVILFVALMLPFVFAESFSIPVLVVASGLVVASFMYSFYLLVIGK